MNIRPVIVAWIALTLGACAVVQPERSAGRQLDDLNASLAIKSAMLRAEQRQLDRVDVEVTEGVALLTGSVPRAEDRIYAECVAWSAPSVRQVDNAVQLGEGRDAGEAARDAWITQRVRTRLVADPAVRSMNFNIESYGGAVHLLGFARSDDERQQAAMLAAGVGGVVRVVDLVRVAGQRSPLPARGARQAAACQLEPAADTAEP